MPIYFVDTTLAGLLLLEDGRLKEWNVPRLFAGALVLMWASCVHYYASAAIAGVAVYLVWCLKDLGWKRGRPRARAVIAGAAVFAVPYLAWYVLPHFREILVWIRNQQGGGTVAVSIRSHFDLYAAWAKGATMPLVVAWPMALGIPLMLISTALLLAVRSTRGIALAALPLQATIRFARNVEDVSGFGGVRPPRDSMPPAGAVRVDGVLELSAIQPAGPRSRLERLPQIRVTVPAGPGEFSAALPVSHAQFIPGICWAQVRFKVLRGRVELTAFHDPNTFLGDSDQLYRSSEPQDLALKLSNLSEVTKILVRNAGGISSPNQAQPLEVEILDAAVFVDAKDWPQVKARLADQPASSGKAP